MRSNFPEISGALLAVAIACLACDVAIACPTCKAALAAGDGSGGDLAAGFSYSILFMMGMPFLLTSVISFGMYRSVKNARAAGWGVEPPLGNQPNQSEPTC